jgi:hypothetical protein
MIQHSNPDLRRRQAASLERMHRATAGLEMSRKDRGMDKANIDKLRTEYPDYYHVSIASIPDGWTALINDFLQEMHGIGDPLDAVSCRFERTTSGLKAFAFPEMLVWSVGQMTTLRAAQRQLYQMSRCHCEWCGTTPAEAVGMGDHVTFFLCQEHKISAEAKLGEQVRRFEDRIKFRTEVSALFPAHTHMVSLHVSDHNTEILQQTLRAILKIVVERGHIGKVLVTKVGESEGQLFMRVTYADDFGDLATEEEINDLVHFAHHQSDKLAVAQAMKAKNDN